MNKDEHYMQRAIDLAKLGAGKVSPNPMVGAVVVQSNRIIGEGWHQAYGGPHAEVNAIQSVADDTLLEGATVYVSLEPCSHTGKTPPCSELLISKKVGRVVVGIGDPNPKVAGSGIRQLEAAGISVTCDVLKEECYQLNRAFFTNQQRHRPYIILKWAQTSDGFIAREDFTSKWISGAESRVLVHKWRAESDAIMVGRNTALHDDPSLTVRDWTGNDPVRIVIDRNNSLPDTLRVFSTPVPTLCYTRNYSGCRESVEWIGLGESITWTQIFEDMLQRGLATVLVEGGAALLTSLINENLWDEARIFVSDAEFGKGIPAPVLAPETLKKTIALPDELYWYLNPLTDG